MSFIGMGTISKKYNLYYQVPRWSTCNSCSCKIQDSNHHHQSWSRQYAFIFCSFSLIYENLPQKANFARIKPWHSAIQTSPRIWPLHQPFSLSFWASLFVPYNSPKLAKGLECPASSSTTLLKLSKNLTSSQWNFPWAPKVMPVLLQFPPSFSYNSPKVFSSSTFPKATRTWPLPLNNCS